MPDARSNKGRVKALSDNTHIIGVGGTENRDSLERLLNIFYYDQFRHSQDPRAPYFMFLSKNGDLALGVGGQVRIKGYFDFNGVIPSPDFSPYNIPFPKDPAQMRQLAATASGTGLFFTLLGHNKLFGNFMAYFQADFGGYQQRGFRIKKAYVNIGDWTAGYTTTTFEDTKAEPETVDGAGPNGINSRKNILVRYMHTWKNKWSLAGSVEFPDQSISVDGKNTAACTPYIPDLAAFLQFQWGGGDSHIRLSGLARTLTYRDLKKKRNYNILGWAGQLSFVINPVAPLTIYGIASAGEGHASYTTDLGNTDFDLIPDEGNPGKLYAPFATGCVIGAQYYFTKSLYADVAFSQQTYYPRHDPENTEYKEGIYAVGNLFWNITPRFQVGIEYLYGLRENFNTAYNTAQRVMAQMQFNF